jgi:hypothetical protein
VPKHTINYGGEVFELKFSAEVPQSNGGYINEYYLPEADFSNWTEVVRVHYYPEVEPINFATSFRRMIPQPIVHSHLTTNPNRNAALLSYLLNRQDGFKFTIVKFENSPKGGTAVLQYTHRHASAQLAEEKMKKHSRMMNWEEVILGTPIPPIVEKVVGNEMASTF